MKGAIKKLLIFIGAIAVGAVALWLYSLRPAENFSDKYEGTDLTVDAEGAVLEGTYAKYQKQHEGAPTPNHSVEVDLFTYKDASLDQPHFAGKYP